MERVYSTVLNKYFLNTSKIDMKSCYHLKVSLLIFIKILSNQLFGNSSFPINTNLETINFDFSGEHFEIIQTSFYQPFIYFDEMQISGCLPFIKWSLRNSTTWPFIMQTFWVIQGWTDFFLGAQKIVPPNQSIRPVETQLVILLFTLH